MGIFAPFENTYVQNFKLDKLRNFLESNQCNYGDRCNHKKWHPLNDLLQLYVESKEGKRRGVIWFGENKTPFIESVRILDEETFLTVKKARVLTGKNHNRQERKDFNVKRTKPPRNKGRWCEKFVPIKK